MKNFALAASDADRSIASSATATQRLDVFTRAQVGDVSRQLGPIASAPWPRIGGCLAILFTSRSGSTCLARRLECAFAIGRLRESLNPYRVRGTSAAQIVEGRQDPWFSFKAGPDGLIAAELCGLFDIYLRQTSFVLLRRRDVVAQAVSCVKANQTGRWHSIQEQMGAASYDELKVAEYISLIINAVGRLQRYIENSGRPWRTLTYEDFADGDFATAMDVCDDLAVPRRHAGSRIRPRPVDRIGDATNAQWIARFRKEMDGAMRDRIEAYSAEL